MQYNPKLDEFMNEYIEALDNATPEDFGMHQVCGTVMCAAGNMAMRRERVSVPPSRVSLAACTAITERFMDITKEASRLAACSLGNPLRALFVLFGGHRVKYAPNDDPENVIYFTPEEQIARQRKVAEWFLRRNRALWAHEQRQALPRRERKAFDIAEKVRRVA